MGDDMILMCVRSTAQSDINPHTHQTLRFHGGGKHPMNLVLNNNRAVRQ
jgi:hypothetical protein